MAGGSIMKSRLNAFAVISVLTASLSYPAAAQNALDVNRMSCETLIVFWTDPEVFNETAGVFIEGVLTGLTAAGFANRAAALERLVETCDNDRTLSFASAIAAAFRD
jgi:hypothetical protein